MCLKALIESGAGETLEWNLDIARYEQIHGAKGILQERSGDQ